MNIDKNKLWEKCLLFIKDNMRKGNKLLACYHDEASIDGYLDDYAFFSLACLEFLKIKWVNLKFDF